MGTYDYAILGAILCGIIMVFGGIVLLYKGAIRLQVASKDPALTVEMFQNELKFSTRNPALGLFVIGLCFVALSIYFGQDMAATAIEVRGRAENVDEKVTILLQSQWPVDTHEGRVHQVVRPQLDVLWVVVSAPGYKPHYKSFARRELKRGVDFGSVTLTKATPKINPNPARIADLPAGVESPPMSEGGSFGAGGPL